MIPEPVPHVEDLFRLGLAKPVAFNAKGTPTHWTISPRGQQMINDAMTHNAREARK